MSEEKELSFYEKLSALISELKTPKSQRNNFGKYNYRSAEDILEAVKPLANKYGLVPKLTDGIVLIGDRYYVEARAIITDGKNTEQASGFAREPESKKGMDESQITGTASSYARKYAMNGLYQIDDTKDADTDEYKQQVDSSKPARIDSTKAKVLRAKVKELSILAGLKTGTEITPEAMYEKLSDTKFLSIVPIEKLDTEQFMTIDRYIKELEKAYSKK
ncbi:MAG: ERF family protein [Enterococcus sp.]|uniref:ERF family protein n=1 Tax=Enterococcus sp. TaxID=35783 RepID=UPI002647A857|nr:ERF family protein [Enterococcus sp.]MDN6004555.1 ERF family protein [Enterococcus sp.]MDN6559977.1 ERF family protein [Enterococcus sp.]MDN6776666.1 ERF family protein [Enterococcus sp.]